MLDHSERNHNVLGMDEFTWRVEDVSAIDSSRPSSAGQRTLCLDTAGLRIVDSADDKSEFASKVRKPGGACAANLNELSSSSKLGLEGPGEEPMES